MREADRGIAWNPEDISSSSDEGDTIVARSTSQPTEPEPPPLSAQSSQHAKSGRSPRKSRSKAGSEDQRSSATADLAANARDRAALMFGKTAQAAVGNESSDNQKSTSRKSRKNKFELQPDEIEFPQFEHTQQGNDVTQQEEQQQAGEVNTTGSPNVNGVRYLQVRNTPGKSGRFPCPEAKKYNCATTFVTQRSALRHLQLHLDLPKLQCPVCSKICSRIDKFKAHKLTHSKEELEAAIEQATQQEQTTQQEEAVQLEEAVQQEDERIQEVEQNETVQEDERIEEAELNETAGDSEDINSPGEAVVEELETTLAPNVEESAETSPKASSDALVARSSDAIMTGAVNQSSTDVSATPASVFDDSVDKDMVEETPRPRSKLKRKRSGLTATQATVQSSAKRRRRTSLSPPTSVASAEDEDKSIDQESDSGEKAVPFKIPLKSKKSNRTGNLDHFAKAWTPGSQLYHPIHNPRSPRVDTGHRVKIVVPQTARAGPSTSSAVKLRKSRLEEGSNEDGEQQTPLSGKTVYTSPKGKRKAEAGVMYSSPPPRIPDEDIPEDVGPVGMATSVARRTSSVGETHKKQKKMKKDKVVARLEDSDSELRSRDTADVEKPFVCKVCHRKYFTKDALRTHERRPGVHDKLQECDDCDGKFMTIEDLKQHQTSTGHGNGTGYAGRTGFFSPGEKRKLLQWRENFCQENDINIATFSQMMTDTLRRTKGFQWPYRFISKQDFLKEYYELLPGRNRRSMHRFRERVFQNVPSNQEWTPDDDDELEQLVDELGPKWVEIGQRMTRTQDQVSQRWRFKVKYRGKAHQGEWLKSEEEKLRAAVTEVKKQLGLANDASTDERLPWDSVSKKMKEKRTAQQCSNKWRAMTQIRAGNKFIKISDQASNPGTPISTTTPSRMSQRLSGQTPSKNSNKKPISEEIVRNSDDSDNDRDEPAETSEVDSIPRSNRSIGDPLQKGSRGKIRNENIPYKTPKMIRRALPDKTPSDSHSLSQAFAQTQANTSALRAPSTTRKQHTQTEMPTPGIPIQHKPVTSPWRAINSNGLSRDDVDDGLVEIDTAQAVSDDEDAIMAEPESSDAESQSIQEPSNGLVETEASEASEVSEAEEASEAEEGTESTSSKSDSSSSTGSDHATDSDAEESESNSTTSNTQKNAFVQSLQSSQALGRRPHSKTNWDSVLHGKLGSTQQETASDSEDEGDIDFE